MPNKNKNKHFEINTLESFESYVSNFDFKRTIKEIHIHHTWKPDYSDYNGKNAEQLHTSMKRYHVSVRHFRSIAQHLTIFPDGKIWIGRDFNTIPASIKGRNSYGICIENVGNFDNGHDTMTSVQLRTLVGVVAILSKRLHLIDFQHKNPSMLVDKIIYHNEYASKSCPGTGFINKPDFIKLILNNHTFNSNVNGVEHIMNTHTQQCKELTMQIQKGLNEIFNCKLSVDGIFGEKTFEKFSTMLYKTGTQVLLNKLIKAKVV